MSILDVHLAGQLLVSVLDTWKGRLRAAEAVLAAEPGKMSERLVRNTLTSVVDALRGSIDRLELTLRDVADLRHSAKALQQRSELFLRSLPIASVTTSPSGDIVAANSKAGLLLNTSTGHLAGKSLLLFLEARDTCIGMMRELQESGAAVHWLVTLRPRERARKQVFAYIARLDEDTVQWFLLPNNRDA